MFYININEERKIICSSENKDNGEVAVDYVPPVEEWNIYKLKTDFESFTGIEQYQIDNNIYIPELRAQVTAYCTEKFYEAMNTPYSYYSFTYKANWKDLYVSMGYSIDKGYTASYEIRNAEWNETKTLDASNKDGIIQKMGEVFDSLFTQKHYYEEQIQSATTVDKLEQVKAGISYNVN